MKMISEKNSIDKSKVSIKDPITYPQNSSPQGAIATFHSGPLPAPEAFEKYNKTLPGAAERILKLVENQAKHRQALEDRHQLSEERARKHDVRLAYLGQFFAFIIAILGGVGGVYSLYLGYPNVAYAIVCGGLAPMIAPFLRNLYVNKKLN